MRKDMGNKKLYNSADMLQGARISYRQLYHWETKGLLDPNRIKLGSREFKRYKEKDLYTAKLIREMLDEGYALPNLKMLDLIIKRKKLEEELKFRLKIEKALHSVSDNFVNPKNLDIAVQKSLQMLGEAIRVNRVYIFEFSEDKKEMSNTYEFCINAESQIDNLQNISTDDFQWWMDNLKRKKNIIIKDVSKLDNERLRDVLSVQEIKSLLVVSLYHGEELLGFMGFDDTIKIRDWNEEDVTILRTASEILIRGITHNRNINNK